MERRIELDELAERLGEVIEDIERDGTRHIIARDDEDVAALVALSELADEGTDRHDAETGEIAELDRDRHDDDRRGAEDTAPDRKSWGAPDVKSGDLPDSDTLLARIDALRAEVGMPPFGDAP